MKREAEKSLYEVNAFLAVYLSYTAFFCIRDIADLTFFFLKLSQGTFVSHIIAAVILFACIFILRYNIKLTREKKDWFFYVASIFILCFGVFKLVIPDTSTDTGNYHLMAQIPGFFPSLIEDNLMPGNIQMFFSLLSDRLFYPFRMLLGYRGGTIFNSILQIGIYGQTINLIRQLCGKELDALRGLATQKKLVYPSESFLAFAVSFPYNVVMQTGLYFVDLTGIPLGLGMLHIVVKPKEDITKSDAVFLALLAGLYFAFKWTNIIFIVPIVIIFIIKAFSLMKLNTWAVCGILCVLPVSSSSIYSAYNTGNPFYPLFPKIFPHQYGGLINGVSTGFSNLGPTNIVETMFWPFYMIIRPDYRQDAIPDKFPYLLAMGIIFIIITAIQLMQKKIKLNDHAAILSVIHLVELYLWAVTSSIPRYFIFGFLVAGMMGVILAYRLFLSQTLQRKAISFALIALFMIQPAMSFREVYKGKEWSWRGFNKVLFKENLHYVLNDYNIKDPIIEDVDLFALFQRANGSFANLINPDVPIISHFFAKNTSDSNIGHQFLAILNKYFDSEQKVYDVLGYNLTEASFQSYTERLNEYGVYIENMHLLDNHFVYNHKPLLTQLTRATAPNEIYYAGRENASILCPNVDGALFKCIVAPTTWYYWSSPVATFYIEAQGASHSSIVFEQQVSVGQIYPIDIKIDLSEFDEKNVILKFGLNNKDGEDAEKLGPYEYIVVNPRFY